MIKFCVQRVFICLLHRTLCLQVLQLVVKSENTGLKASLCLWNCRRGWVGRTQVNKLLRETENLAQTFSLWLEKSGWKGGQTDPSKFPGSGVSMKHHNSLARSICSSCWATVVSLTMLLKMRPEPMLMELDHLRIIVGLISSFASSPHVQGQ